MTALNSTEKKRIKASDLPSIISRRSSLRKSIQTRVQIYVFALMISGYSKTYKNIAIFFGLAISSLSRMLSNSLLGKELDIALNRQVRQILAAYFNKHEKITVEIIIDATLLERSSREAENVSLYHSSGEKKWGHRITNVGLLLDGEVYVPLAAIAHYTRPYARKLGLAYLTEGIMVTHWLRDHMSGLLDLLMKASIEPEDVTFLLDAGYDNAMIQNAIRKLGCHFIMMVKCTRSIGGMQVKEFFTRHRNLAWTSVYFNKMVNGKNKRRKYRIRTAKDVELANVGPVNVVCSEKAGGSRKFQTRRYLVASNLNLRGREILNRYFKRWKIETWHKEIKQNYGFNDCSASTFTAIENHIKLCVIAYLCHLQGFKTLPARGTTINDYLQYSIRKETRMILRRIKGNEKLEDDLSTFEEEIFTKAA